MWGFKMVYSVALFESGKIEIWEKSPNWRHGMCLKDSITKGQTKHGGEYQQLEIYVGF